MYDSCISFGINVNVYDGISVGHHPQALPRKVARDDSLAGDPDFPSRRGTHYLHHFALSRSFLSLASIFNSMF
jgi:hypothetical protein